MGKGKFTFTLFAVLGAIAGYTTYMVSKDEFSEETKDKAIDVIQNVQNFSNDFKRTYTSLGDADDFIEKSSNLSDSSMELAQKAGTFLASASSDMYHFARKKIENVVTNIQENAAAKITENEVKTTNATKATKIAKANKITKDTKSTKSTKGTKTTKATKAATKDTKANKTTKATKAKSTNKKK